MQSIDEGEVVVKGRAGRGETINTWSREEESHLTDEEQGRKRASKQRWSRQQEYQNSRKRQSREE
jgi:hypothetical protein